MESYLIPAIIILMVIMAIVWNELDGKDKTIERQGRWISKAKEKLAKQKEIILSYQNKRASFSDWMTKEQIMESKGWSESQFTTMMWALRKEGYAKAQGKSRSRTYSIIQKKK